MHRHGIAHAVPEHRLRDTIQPVAMRLHAEGQFGIHMVNEQIVLKAAEIEKQIDGHI